MANEKPDPYGLRAASPSEMPKRAWKAILARTYKRTWDDNVALVSAGVAFYAFFALLSLLALIVLVYGFVVPDRATVLQHVGALTTILPTDIAHLIGDQLTTVVKSSQESKGFGILLTGLIALYGGVNGASALLTALNIAYEEKERRSLLHFYVLALAITFVALVGALLAIAGVAAVAYLQTLLPEATPLAVTVGKIAGYAALAIATSLVIAALYRFGPSREDAKWRWITPGSVFASFTWLLLTVAFGFYLSRLTDYQASYGSLAAVVALLTWLYFSAYAFVFGAELNSEIEHQTAQDSTTGHPQPMGERGAWAADHVAVSEDIEDRPEEAREGEKLTAAAPQVAKED